MASNFAASNNILSVAGEFDPFADYTELHLADGRSFRVATVLLTPDQPTAITATRGTSQQTEQIVIPVVEEQLSVGLVSVPTAAVRLHKTVQEFETNLNEPLAIRTFDVERVILNQPVEHAPEVRHEGDTTIYPVLEEQLILTKQLVLKEEVRVTRRDTERIDTQAVTLRREHIEVERESVA